MLRLTIKSEHTIEVCEYKNFSNCLQNLVNNEKHSHMRNSIMRSDCESERI